MANSDIQIKCKKAVVNHTNTAAKKLFTLPKGALLLRIYVQVQTAFNDSGTDLLDIGTQADNAYFVNDHTLSGFGAATLVNGGELTVAGPVLDVFGKYIGQNSNATAGKALVICEYADSRFS